MGALCARSGSRTSYSSSGALSNPGAVSPALLLLSEPADLRALVLRPPPSFFVSARAMRSARRDRPPLDTAPTSPDAPTPPSGALAPFSSKDSLVSGLVAPSPSPELEDSSSEPLIPRSAATARGRVCAHELHFFSASSLPSSRSLLNFETGLRREAAEGGGGRGWRRYRVDSLVHLSISPRGIQDAPSRISRHCQWACAEAFQTCAGDLASRRARPPSVELKQRTAWVASIRDEVGEQHTQVWGEKGEKGMPRRAS